MAEKEEGKKADGEELVEEEKNMQAEQHISVFCKKIKIQPYHEMKIGEKLPMLGKEELYFAEAHLRLPILQHVFMRFYIDPLIQALF